MSKLQKNESGFSAVEVVLVLVIVALIGTVGWLVYKNHHKTTTAAITTTSATKPTTSTTTKTTTKTTTTTPSTTTVVKIPELSIEITVPNSIDDLTYHYTSSTSGSGAKELTADLSTSSLAAQVSSCTANSSTDSANFDALGVLGNYQGQFSSAPDFTLVKQYSTYYIAYNEPQDTCLPSGASTTLVNLLSSQQQALQGALSTVQPIQ